MTGRTQARRRRESGPSKDIFILLFSRRSRCLACCSKRRLFSRVLVADGCVSPREKLALTSSKRRFFPPGSRGPPDRPAAAARQAEEEDQMVSP